MCCIIPVGSSSHLLLTIIEPNIITLVVRQEFDTHVFKGKKKEENEMTERCSSSIRIYVPDFGGERRDP